jgi:HTH-type transcriptional repressor of NAD biosynthesis genes
MTRAFVLMAAIPPTIGHLRLIQFAAALVDEVCVIVGTQPGEPYPDERVDAVRRATASLPGVRVEQLHKTLPQRPEDAPDFWPMWRRLLREHGMRDGDTIVASETYGAKLAETSGGVFVPYDLERSITPVRATAVREDPIGLFVQILPEFQPVFRRRITVLGAESTGKTTLSKALAESLPGHWLPEWARPYLEQLPSPEITLERMHVIWRAQRALQSSAKALTDKPFIVQDTDLFATVGFWQAWDLTSVPQALIEDAFADRSDLYLITRSNIPFEPDPLRYGGEVRETTDAFWIDLAKRHRLNAVVIEAATPSDRLDEATCVCRDSFMRRAVTGFQRT